MSARSGGFLAIQGTANAKTWPVEDVIRARSREQGARSQEKQAAARGQFALFGEGRALEAMVSEARSWEQGARSGLRDSAALSA
jgi:hypothetical protein